MAIPADAAGWLQLIREGMPPFWRSIAERSGGSVWEDGDVLAAVFPMAPERSVFNSVFYEDGERLLASLDRIASAYEEAGVRAWTVWVPEAEEPVARALADAGHLLDAEPRAMAMEISELQAPRPDEAIELREESDMAEVARLNEIAYGWAPGEFEAVGRSEGPDTFAYFASMAGKTVGTTVAWDYSDDAQIAWVATLPEARGRGVASQLTAQAVAEAGRRGRCTTTLVATTLGRPVYDKLGYRDFGALQMWERRKA
ncbi:MAG: GNAT family N-acetyltransferase [Solirubrobacterales bacterium]